MSQDILVRSDTVSRGRSTIALGDFKKRLRNYGFILVGGVVVLAGALEVRSRMDQPHFTANRDGDLTSILTEYYHSDPTSAMQRRRIYDISLQIANACNMMTYPQPRFDMESPIPLQNVRARRDSGEKHWAFVKMVRGDRVDMRWMPHCQKASGGADFFER
jgi:hypothetical protein